MKIVRDHLQNRLHGICRDCESESTEFYMTSRELWRRALAGTYRTGVLCLRCLARRLAPRQLFAEDLSNGTGGAGSLPRGDWDFTDPASGTTFKMQYKIGFPGREGPPSIRCERTYYVLDNTNDNDLPDAFLDAGDDQIAWLWDYCREHHLDLVVDGETVLVLGAKIEIGTNTAGRR